MPEVEQTTGLFRSVALYRALRQEVMPLLRTWPSVKVWHAGLADGVEVYATAIVLREEGLLERATIWATDPEPERVSAARAGTFSASLLATASADYTASGGTQTLAEYSRPRSGIVEMRSLLAERVIFSEHDASRDGSFNEFQLVLHHSRAARPGFGSRRRGLGIVDESLCRFGVLLLADGSRLDPETMRARYENLVPGKPVWRKLA